MEKVLVLQPFKDVTLGLYEQTLMKEGVLLHAVTLEDTMPDVEGYDAVLMTGGPQSANDAEMTGMIEVVENAIDMNKPFFGVCLGLQAGVKAGKGKVVAANPEENGLYGADGERLTVYQTEEGLRSPLLRGLPDSFGTFQVHNETVVLGKNMVSLAKSNDMHQIVQIAPNAYGVQFHTELSQKKIHDWAVNAPGLKNLDQAKLFRDFNAAYPRHRRIARLLMQNFIGIANSGRVA